MTYFSAAIIETIHLDEFLCCMTEHSYKYTALFTGSYKTQQYLQISLIFNAQNI